MANPRRELADLAAAVRAEAERLERRGVRRVDVPPGAATAPARAPRKPKAAAVARAAASTPAAAPAKAAPPKSAAAPAGAGASAKPAAAAPPAADGARGKKLAKVAIEPEPADYAARMKELAALQKTASTCTKCHLCKTRKQVVFGAGKARTRVMFIGEAPGGDEDRLGFPFVGRAGKLLDQIIDAVGFEREQVYIANILKCRPPENRDPAPVESEACTPYLERQIELVNPKIICALGRFAAQFLTGQPTTPIGRLRGKVHYYKDRIMVLPTYHPAALLRNPNFKRTVWEDVQVLRKEYLR